MTASQPTTASFIPWPEPSPTSKYRINLRYYRTIDINSKVQTDWDIGPEFEHLLEQYYTDMPNVRTQTPKEYEQDVRTLLQNRIDFMAGTTIYPAVVSFLLGDGNDLFDDMMHQTDMVVTLHNRLAKMSGGKLRTNPLKSQSFWKKLFA